MSNYATSLRLDLRSMQETPIALPKEGVLQWITDSQSKITLRPSGTEPKIKLYLEVRGQSHGEAQSGLSAIKSAFDDMVQAGLGA